MATTTSFSCPKMRESRSKSLPTSKQPQAGVQSSTFPPQVATVASTVTACRLFGSTRLRIGCSKCSYTVLSLSCQHIFWPTDDTYRWQPLFVTLFSAQCFHVLSTFSFARPAALFTAAQATRATTIAPRKKKFRPAYPRQSESTFGRRTSRSTTTGKCDALSHARTRMHGALSTCTWPIRGIPPHWRRSPISI